MENEPKSFAFKKWIAGIAATVIAALVIWWFTHPGGLINPEPAIMDISGVWLTPFDNLSYKVTQNNHQYSWIIRESGVSGSGTIEGNTLISLIEGKKVVYEALKWDSKGNPVVLFTTDSDFFGVVLFRTCDDFKLFLKDLGDDFPKLKTQIYNAVRNLKNPTCPAALDELQ